MIDDLSLTVGSRMISGWTDIRVSRGIERLPSDFEIGLTERYRQSNRIVVQPGEQCQVRLGDDLVLTGFVDRYIPSMDQSSHTIRILGRSKCEDLVDCAAVWPNGQISGTSAVDVATKLAAHYGIDVHCDVTGLPVIPQFNIFIGESAYEIIERISRYSALLVYDEPDGSLRLAQAGSVQAAGGFAQGVNVQAASVEHSMDQRFSKYTAFVQSVQTYGDIGVGGMVLAEAVDAGFPSVNGAPRVRERYVIAEAVQGFKDLAQRRATWEMNQRIGRSEVISLVTDSWRDADGALWTPNTLVSVSLPHLNLTQNQERWLIGAVTYQRNAQTGTTASLTIMRPEAFLPQPTALLPFFVDGSNTGGS